MEWYWCAALGVVVIGLYFHFTGNPNFWKLTRKHPEEALQFFQNNPDVWKIYYDKPSEGYDSHAPRAEWSGPFRIAVPSFPNQLLVVYGRADKIEASQQQFLRLVTEPKSGR